MRLATLTALALSAACLPSHGAAAADDAARKLHARFDAGWERNLRENPLAASQVGDSRYDDQDLGAKFDIRAFHEVMLGSGAVPLGVLERNVANWQKQVASATATAAGAGQR